LEECCRFAPDTQLEGGSKEQRRLPVEGRKGVRVVMARKRAEGP